jgi:hypothetical protein
MAFCAVRWPGQRLMSLGERPWRNLRARGVCSETPEKAEQGANT